MHAHTYIYIYMYIYIYIYTYIYAHIVGQLNETTTRSIYVSVYSIAYAYTFITLMLQDNVAIRTSVKERNAMWEV